MSVPEPAARQHEDLTEVVRVPPPGVRVQEQTAGTLEYPVTLQRRNTLILGRERIVAASVER